MDKTKFDYDFIIIGGGAVGCGIALDAITRGYKVLLLEKNDFGSGASSKSTKLVHGGVRYLEKAILTFNKAQYKLVNEALKERAIFLKNSSTISKKFQIFTPLYNWFEAIYLYIGLKIYELISLSYSLGKSSFVSKKILGFLKQKNLKGAISYFDGSFNDSKMITSLLITAQNLGTDVKNYCEVKEFLYDNKRIVGLKYFDKIENKEFEISSKVVVNATGVSIDTLRRVDDYNCSELITTSKGSHIVLSKEFMDLDVGLLIPKTHDGRVIFFHPWENILIIGTTEVDNKAKKISDDEIDYLLFYANKYLKKEAKKEDVLSTFSGTRALIKKDIPLSSIVREYIINISKTNLVSISAGKWTSYRKMAEDCLNVIFSKSLIKEKASCKTKECELLSLESLEINEADIIFAIENYFVKRPIDILLRITNIAYKNRSTALKNIEFICEIMAKYFSWNEEKKDSEIEFSKDYIKSRF
ncbi:MAG: glycerol-3-phosphate dehydrogenase [Arcobacter sp.]|uniref:glycerol-3-phosphate dehydrogenase/oxidase n=1 Tax=uncultured Arcobacter sp. TaxID=165434 RepID=UPI000CA67B88|nr:FAD-dependent oxidoreductase [uncultured Arcobacter sp.]PLY09258.1 MAG: glycerol-3-phosphate dehydrogenase [Arcobacter sp.]